MKRAAAALLLLGGTAQPPLRPGLWEVLNAPERATLNGAVLHDLPLDPIKSERLCLTPDQAAAPAAWLARDLGPGCTLTRARVGGGTADIAGTCPPADAKAAPGTVTIAGAASADRYELRFATTAAGEIGTMGFSGRMTGRRIGDCPAG